MLTEPETAIERNFTSLDPDSDARLTPASSPLRASSLHFVRTNSLSTDTARDFLLSLGADLPAFRSPQKKRTARRSLRDILGVGNCGACSGEDRSVSSAPALLRSPSQSPVSTVLPFRSSHTCRGSIPAPSIAPAARPPGSPSAPLGTATGATPDAPAATMTAADEIKAASTSLRDRIAVFQKELDKVNANASSSGAGAMRSKPTLTTKASRAAVPSSTETDQAPSRATTSRRLASGGARTSANAEGVSDAARRMQARNQTALPNHSREVEDAEDNSHDGRELLKTPSSSLGRLRNLGEPNQSNRTSSGLSLASLYASQPTMPSPTAIDTGEETDDASVVVETVEQMTLRKARRQAAKDQLQAEAAATDGTAAQRGVHRGPGGFTSSDDESVAPDRQRRAGKRKVKLRARDLGLTEAELKTMNPKELQGLIKQWKKEHPKIIEVASHTEAGASDDGGGRGRQQQKCEEKPRSRSRSRADVKRRAQSLSRKHSQDETRRSQTGSITHSRASSRGRARSTESVADATKEKESRRNRSASRNRSARSRSRDDEDRSIGTTLTAGSRRRDRSTTRRKSGSTSAISSADHGHTQTMSVSRSHSVGRSRSSRTSSALNVALDKVATHGDERLSRTKMRDRETEYEESKSRRRSKSVGNTGKTSRSRSSERELVSPNSPDYHQKSVDVLQRNPDAKISDKSPSSSRRRSRSSAPSSRSTSGKEIPQFALDNVEFFESPSFSEKNSPLNHGRQQLETTVKADTGVGAARTRQTVHEHWSLESSPMSDLMIQSKPRKSGRSISDMSPSKLRISALQKIRGVFGSRTSIPLVDQPESPPRSPANVPTRGAIRSKSDDSIFGVFDSRKNLDSVGGNRRSMLRQPSGGADAFETANDPQRRRGTRRRTERPDSESPEELEQRTLLAAGISEELLQKLHAAGFEISKMD